MTSDVIHCLEWCGQTLSTQEDALSEQEISEISQNIEQLRASISNSKLPEAALLVLRRHLTILERAFQAYDIRGASSFKEGVHQAAGDLVEFGDVLTEHKDAPEVSLLGKALGTMKKAGDKIQWADKTTQSGGKLMELFSKLLETLG